MTNREKYAEEIIDIVLTGYGIALENDEPVHCERIDCVQCDLCGYGIKSCKEKLKEWAEQEYVPYVDWSKVEVDTPILVRDNEKNAEWSKRHFAKCEDGVVFAWNNGHTSWTSLKVKPAPWKYAKLAEEEDMK